jgi:hypothetical protein
VLGAERQSNQEKPTKQKKKRTKPTKQKTKEQNHKTKNILFFLAI